jgi:SAM-dependent methyltransferase
MPSHHPIPDLYVCPACHSELRRDTGPRICVRCGRTFTEGDGVPDFLLQPTEESDDPFLRGVESFVDKLASIYETPLWLPLQFRGLGGRGAATLGETRHFVRGLLDDIHGPVLDLACGTGTFGRCVATDDRPVHSVDISRRMLLKGRDYSRRERIDAIRFARADARTLPFADGVFDACLFSGALHIFVTDLVAPLREARRVLTAGAPLWITTVVRDDGRSALRNRFQRNIVNSGRMHLFDLAELDPLLDQAGFITVRRIVQGCLLSLTARAR